MSDFAVGSHVSRGRGELVSEVTGRDGDGWLIRSLYLGAAFVSVSTEYDLDGYRLATAVDHARARRYADWFNGEEVPYWEAAAE